MYIHCVHVHCCNVLVVYILVFRGQTFSTLCYMLALSVIVIKICDAYLLKRRGLQHLEKEGRCCDDVRGVVSSCFVAAVLVCLLISRPHNVILVAFQLFMMTAVDHLLRTDVIAGHSQLVVVCFWMGNASFFFQVNHCCSYFEFL